MSFSLSIIPNANTHTYTHTYTLNGHTHTQTHTNDHCMMLIQLTELEVSSLVEDHAGSGGSQHLCQAGQVKHCLVAKTLASLSDNIFIALHLSVVGDQT